MQGSSDLHEENIKVYFEEKLDKAIKSLKGYLYTLVVAVITCLVALVVVCVSLGALSNEQNMATVLIGVGSAGIIGGLVILVTFISHIIYNISAALRFGGLFNLLNSCQSSNKIVKTSSQEVELVNIIKSTRNYLWGNLAMFILGIVISQWFTLGLLFTIASIVIFVLAWKNKNKLVRFREEGTL